MYRPTSPQVSLLESQFLLPEDKRRRLEQSWAQPFQERILPLNDEEAFRDAFSEETGRPNKSIRLPHRTLRGLRDERLEVIDRTDWRTFTWRRGPAGGDDHEPDEE